MKREWQEEFLEKQNELIRAIAQQVSNTIPDTWEKFYFHADINDDFSGGVYFFFNTEKGKKLNYSHDIPEIYNINEDEYDEKYDKLYELSVDLKQLFIDCEQEPWQAITIIVDEKGLLKMDYDYADWLSSPYTPTPLMNYFKHKYLGKIPKDKEEEKLFKEMEEYQSKFNK